jgi:hypothetical protein
MAAPLFLLSRLAVKHEMKKTLRGSRRRDLHDLSARCESGEAVKFADENPAVSV